MIKRSAMSFDCYLGLFGLYGVYLSKSHFFSIFFDVSCNSIWESFANLGLGQQRDA